MEKRGFTEKEIDFLRKLNNPTKVQEFISTLDYTEEERVSLIHVFREKKADCLSASCLASFIFTLSGTKNFLMDLCSASEKDSDHVICVFMENGLYGAVAQSKYLGLRYKNPVYKNLREIALSYFEDFFNYSGDFDLRRFSVPLKLKIDSKSVSNIKFLDKIEKEINEIKHYDLVPKKIKLPKIDKIAFERGILVMPKGAKVDKQYRKAYSRIKKI